MIQSSPTQIALATLFTVQAVMLAALFAKVQPHPPASLPLFAMAPFLSAALAACLAAIQCGGIARRSGRVLSVAAIAMAAVSFGPHKWFDPAFGQIWPGVLIAQIAIITIVWQLYSRQSSGQKAG